MGKREVKHTKSDLVYNTIKEKIITGEYRPHTIIKQAEVAEELGISTVPVREALLRLTSEGFILHIPYVGVMVSDISTDYLSKVYELRTILEGSAAEIAVKNVAQEDLQLMDNMLDEMQICIDNSDSQVYQEINEKFHFFIYSLSRNELLVDHIKILWKRFPRDTFKTMPDRLSRSLQEHKQIVSAIRKGDPAWVRSLTINHIMAAQDDIRKYKAP